MEPRGRSRMSIKEKRRQKAEYMQNTNFYCDACDKFFSLEYKCNHERTNMHIKNVIILENVPQIHPSEVADILNSRSKYIHSSTDSIGII